MIKRRSICVLGQKIKIIYTKKILVDQAGKQLAGYYDPIKLAVFIHVGSHGQREDFKTVIHELGHALIFRSGLAQIISAEAQEIFCEALSHFIYENFDIRKSKRV